MKPFYSPKIDSLYMDMYHLNMYYAGFSSDKPDFPREKLERALQRYKASGIRHKATCKYLEVPFVRDVAPHEQLAIYTDQDPEVDFYDPKLFWYPTLYYAYCRIRDLEHGKHCRWHNTFIFYHGFDTLRYLRENKDIIMKQLSIWTDELGFKYLDNLISSDTNGLRNWLCNQFQEEKCSWIAQDQSRQHFEEWAAAHNAPDGADRRNQ